MGRAKYAVVEKELVVIGTGMAGMAAALFAVQDGIDTAQVGIMGQINFASGLIDLMGIYPIGENRTRFDPWSAIAELIQAEPDHPYAKLTRDQIESALAKFFDFMASAGLPYHHEDRFNQLVATPVGTRKITYAVPLSMAPGVRAMAQKKPCLIIDFKGLKGFSAIQIASQLKDKWPSLRPARIAIPGTKGELYAEHIARSLESEKNRRALADSIKPHLRDERTAGLPAVLGVNRTGEIVADLERWLGVDIFEIPTMLPAVTGLRLRETFENRLRALGVHSFYQQMITAAGMRSDGSWLLTVGEGTEAHYIRTKSVVLASGRFLGNGLHADRNGVRETVFNLPVKQPADRSKWHRKDLLHLEGHPINRCGLVTDRHFRPVGNDGKPVHANLFAAGSILADQDWVRQKCGSGLAIATAFGAVKGVGSLVRGRAAGK